MCADFSTAEAITGSNEGGWQNDPADPGNNKLGWGTYKGVASAKNPKWKGWPVVVAEIAKLPPQPVYGTKPYRAWVKRLNAALAPNAELQQLLSDFYRVNFWDVNRLSELRSQGVANHCYDHGVSRGTVTAAMLLQKVLGVLVDGIIGPVTLKKANSIDSSILENKYRQARVADYQRLVKNNTSLARYKNTWLKRC